MKDDRYITYHVKNEDDEIIAEMNITFAELEKFKDAINWYYISDNITKETCTKEFYDTFDEYLIWRNCDFLSYVAEEDLQYNNRIKRTGYSNLFYRKPSLSEDFCRKILEDNSRDSFKNLYSYIFNSSSKFSTEFIEDFFRIISNENETKINMHYGNYYNNRYSESINDILKKLCIHQQITEKQFVTYIEKNTYFNSLVTKFSVFIILSSPINNYSVEFIKKHRRDLNQKAFFDTEQVKSYLANNLISKNALMVFKTKINYINLLNFTKKDEILENLLPECRKEIFDLLITSSDKINNENNLKTINSLI